MLDSLKDIIRKSSIHVCLINTGGCNGCDIEVVALLSPRYDIEQYGIYVSQQSKGGRCHPCNRVQWQNKWKDKLQRVYAKSTRTENSGCNW